VLLVSVRVELVLDAVVRVGPVVAVIVDDVVGTAPAVFTVCAVHKFVEKTLEDVDTIDDREYTVLVTLGPSGCLNLASLFPPYSVNQMLVTPVLSRNIEIP
jgi:hypothetical protein